jgi:hypothetical protein
LRRNGAHRNPPRPRLPAGVFLSAVSFRRCERRSLADPTRPVRIRKHRVNRP